MRAMVAVSMVVLAAACSSGASQTPEPESAIPVRLADVVEEEVVRPVSATGTVGSKEEIGLTFKVGGIVGAVRANAGDRVRAGQLLATLELREIDAAVARARSGLAKAERDLERARRLYADSVVTLTQLQDAETAAELARADAEAALFNRRYAVITAPADGVILRRAAEPGELVSAGDPVLTLASRRRGTVVRAGLADRDVVRIRRGDTASVTFAALPGRTFSGTVTEIGAAAQAGTGTWTVEVTLPDGSELTTGLIGTVEIAPAGKGRAQLIPIEAVLEADGSRGSVYVLAADGVRAERRDVTIAFITDDRAAVTSGLEDVARVITEGAAWLNDGVAVRVLP